MSPSIYKPAIALFKGNGLISAAIRWQTRGPYSHAAVLTREGTFVEAWQGAGVREKQLHNFSNIDLYDVPGMVDSQWDGVISFMRSQIGKGYDYWAIIRFISRRNMPANDNWFCSELVFEAMTRNNVHLFLRIVASAVSPSLLGISPRIEPRHETEIIH